MLKEGGPMKYQSRVQRLLTASLVTGFSVGCADLERRRASFDHRVLPPAVAKSQPSTETPAAAGGVIQVRADLPTANPVPTTPTELTSSVGDERIVSGPLTLPEAIALAQRMQPRLRVFLEGVVQARGAERVALAPFLPTVSAGYSVGGFDLNAGGAPLPFGAGTPNFAFLPINGSIPVGLNLNTGYELAELRVQWLLIDFGRRMGRHQQAELGVDVAQLQSDRAYQTVANDVAMAYYQVLRARSLKRVADQAIRRAEDDLDVARKLGKNGVIEKEKVLRAEVLLSQAQRGQDQAEAGVGIAISALNLAIGLNVSAPTEVVDTVNDFPSLRLTLEDCLSQAVANRRELTVAQISIQSAQAGRRVARAEFRPKVEAGGSLLDFQQSAPRAHTDIAVGFLKLEWALFEGGRRVGEERIADSKVRAAASQAESLADTIAFQVNDAYRQLIVARRGIDRSKPAVAQATEAYRLLKARYATGDATPAEVIDAETALTRAEQDQLNSTYDFLSALAKLNFAMGLPPDASTPR
jgi:outer membrane protein